MLLDEVGVFVDSIHCHPGSSPQRCSMVHGSPALSRLLFGFGIAVATSACALTGRGVGVQGSAEMSRVASTSQPNSPARNARVADRTDGWPRTVEDSSGRVTIPAKPMRIHTLSVGYDEITFRLVDPDRIVAVSQSTANPELSNVADAAESIANKVGRNAESIVALQPDLVVASPFSNRDLVEQLRGARIPLV